MKNRIFASIAIFGFTTLVLTSCSKVPQEEIDAATTAIEQAASAGANIYAHDEFILLQDSLNSVMVNIETQKSKFIRNYATAREQLAGVTTYAGEVEQLSETRKQLMKVEIQNTIAEVKTLIEMNRQLILEAPRGKEGTSALMAIRSEIDAVEQSLNATNSLLDTGDYIATLEKARSAQEKALAINTELTGVIAKYKSNVQGKRS